MASCVGVCCDAGPPGQVPAPQCGHAAAQCSGTAGGKHLSPLQRAPGRIKRDCAPPVSSKNVPIVARSSSGACGDRIPWPQSNPRPKQEHAETLRTRIPVQTRTRIRFLGPRTNVEEVAWASRPHKKIDWASATRGTNKKTRIIKTRMRVLVSVGCWLGVGWVSVGCWFSVGWGLLGVGWVWVGCRLGIG